MSVHICSIKRYCVRVNENKLILPMRTMLYKLVATIVVANVFQLYLAIGLRWFLLITKESYLQIIRTYNISHKLLRLGQVPPLPLLNVAAYLKSSNTEACANKLKILANNTENEGRGLVSKLM